jgi:hypothetical protein
MELAGGCVCHEVRCSPSCGRRSTRSTGARGRGRGAGDHRNRRAWSILSGLEDLGAGAPAVAAGVVCVVDAEAGAGQLARHEEARAQVEAADRILLTKLDLAAGDAVVALHRELARRNPAAERASFPVTDEGTAALIPWLLDPRGAPRTSRADRHAHAHGQLTVVTFTDPEPLLAEPLVAVIEALGEALVRAKGFVNLAGDDRRGFLERAGARTGLATGEPWGASPRGTELVLIGDGIDADAIRRQLWACRARKGKRHEGCLVHCRCRRLGNGVRVRPPKTTRPDRRPGRPVPHGGSGDRTISTLDAAEAQALCADLADAHRTFLEDAVVLDQTCRVDADAVGRQTMSARGRLPDRLSGPL